MKKFTALLILGVSLSFVAFPAPTLNEQEQNPSKRGCCSWHGGVCGCDSDGDIICCDGTESPSCDC